MNEETNAADLAQRVADLESIVNAPRGTDAQIMKEREISAAAIDGALAFGYQGCDAPEAGHWLLAAHNAGKRIAELEAEIAAVRAHVIADEGDLPRVDTAQSVAAIVEQRDWLIESCRAVEAERDELRARLAEIEAQEPAIVEAGELRIGFGDTEEAVWLKLSRNIPLGTELFTRPVPAQAVPDGWRLVPVEPTIAMCIAGDSPRMLVDDCTPTPAIYRAMCAAAPEHKA